MFKQGTLFLHGSWLLPVNGERRPALCRVTRINGGLVYYGFGVHATKGSYYQSAEKLLANGAKILSGEELLALPNDYFKEA